MNDPAASLRGETEPPEVAFRTNMFRRRSLFGKYVAAFVGLVVFVLMISSAIDIWFTYRNAKAMLLHA